MTFAAAERAYLMPPDEHECPDERCRCWEHDVDRAADAAAEKADAIRKGEW